MGNEITKEPASQKRKPGRPRKIIPPSRDWTFNDGPYCESFWYLVPALASDDTEFDRLLAEQRKLYAADGFNAEILIYENELTRRGVEPPCGNWGFTAEGLLRCAYASRPPLTHNGTLTASGIAKARILLTRERLMAGAVDIGLTPDLPRLRDYLGPLLSELLIDR